MRLKSFVILLFFITMVLSNSALADIQFSLQSSFSIPGLTDSPEQVAFNDIDRDGSPEVLATDGNSVVLYSLSADSILYRFTFDTLWSFQAFLFDDVTKDSIPDLVIASQKCCPQTCCPAYLGDSSVEVELFDGANDFVNTGKIFGVGDIIGDGYGYFGLLKAIDLNSDGYNELLVSCEVIKDASYAGSWHYYTAGVMFLYDSFPDSLLCRINSYIIDIQQFQMASAENAVWATRMFSNAYITLGPDIYDSYYCIASLKENGDPKDIIEESVAGCWTGDIAENYDATSFGCAGDLNIAAPGTEAVTVYHHRDTCPPEPLGSDFYRLQMHRVITPDSVELLWSRDTSSLNLSNFLYSPDWPGYFMALSDTVFYLFNGADGSVRASVNSPSGAKHWDYVFSNGEPRLIALKDKIISIYSLDISLDSNEPEYDPDLPSSFSLSPPFPNPFNAEVIIPISMNKSGILDVAVYNILGEKVADIFSGQVGLGEIRFDWNAEQYSSGIYFVKASTDSAARTAKLILLK